MLGGGYSMAAKLFNSLPHLIGLVYCTELSGDSVGNTLHIIELRQ